MNYFENSYSLRDCSLLYFYTYICICLLTILEFVSEKAVAGGWVNPLHGHQSLSYEFTNYLFQYLFKYNNTYDLKDPDLC